MRASRMWSLRGRTRLGEGVASGKRHLTLRLRESRPQRHPVGRVNALQRLEGGHHKVWADLLNDDVLPVACRFNARLEVVRSSREVPSLTLAQCCISNSGTTRGLRLIPFIFRSLPPSNREHWHSADGDANATCLMSNPFISDDRLVVYLLPSENRLEIFRSFWMDLDAQTGCDSSAAHLSSGSTAARRWPPFAPQPLADTVSNSLPAPPQTPPCSFPSATGTLKASCPGGRREGVTASGLIACNSSLPSLRRKYFTGPSVCFAVQFVVSAFTKLLVDSGDPVSSPNQSSLQMLSSCNQQTLNPKP